MKEERKTDVQRTGLYPKFWSSKKETTKEKTKKERF